MKSKNNRREPSAICGVVLTVSSRMMTPSPKVLEQGKELADALMKTGESEEEERLYDILYDWRLRASSLADQDEKRDVLLAFLYAVILVVPKLPSKLAVHMFFSASIIEIGLLAFSNITKEGRCILNMAGANKNIIVSVFSQANCMRSQGLLSDRSCESMDTFRKLMDDEWNVPVESV